MNIDEQNLFRNGIILLRLSFYISLRKLPITTNIEMPDYFKSLIIWISLLNYFPFDPHLFASEFLLSLLLLQNKNLCLLHCYIERYVDF